MGGSSGLDVAVVSSGSIGGMFSRTLAEPGSNEMVVARNPRRRNFIESARCSTNSAELAPKSGTALLAAVELAGLVPQPPIRTRATMLEARRDA